MIHVVAALAILNPPPAGISAKQWAELQTTEQDIYLPTYVPSGFSTAVHVEVGKEPDLTSYSVDYVCAGKEFWIQTASEGIGDVFLTDADGNDVEPQGAFTAKTKLFGTVEVGFHQSRELRWVVNWLETPTKSRPHFVSLAGTGFARETVKRIIQSIRRFPAPHHPSR